MKEWICVDCGKPAGYRRKRCKKCNKIWRKDYNYRYYWANHKRVLDYHRDYATAHRHSTTEFVASRQKKITAVNPSTFQHSAQPEQMLSKILNGEIIITGY